MRVGGLDQPCRGKREPDFDGVGPPSARLVECGADVVFVRRDIGHGLAAEVSRGVEERLDARRVHGPLVEDLGDR